MSTQDLTNSGSSKTQKLGAHKTKLSDENMMTCTLIKVLNM